jgi:hypothetical protein
MCGHGCMRSSGEIKWVVEARNGGGEGMFRWRVYEAEACIGTGMDRVLTMISGIRMGYRTG